MILAKTYIQTWAFIKKCERGNFCCIENMFTYKLRCVKGSWNNLRFFYWIGNSKNLSYAMSASISVRLFHRHHALDLFRRCTILKLQTSKLMKVKDINVCQKLTLKVLFVKIFIINCLFHNRK